MKKALLAILSLLVALGPAACAHHHGPAPGQLTLGMVTDVGGLGDGSFNDSAYRGLKSSQAQLNAYIQVLQSRSAADYQPNLNALSNLKFDMIYGVGFLMSKDLEMVAKDETKTHFCIIDAVVEAPNVVSVTFREQEGSFLAGALAAMMSKTHHLGFIGGQDIPLLQKFEAGYIAGAREVDPNVKVDVKYVGSFDDVAAGKEIANVIFNDGADIIYHAAGKAGLGVIDAVKSRSNSYVIGVDSDQDGEAPGRVLTSMIKKVDVAVFDVAKAMKEGKPMTGHLELGIKDGAVGLTDFKYTKATIGNERLARLKAIEDAMRAGKIVPPDSRAALPSFKPVAI